MGPGPLDPIDRFNRSACSGPTAFNYEKDMPGRRRQERDVGKAESWGGVDDDDVRALGCLIQYCAHTSCRKKIRRVWWERTTRQQREMLMLGGDHMAVDWVVAGQQLGEANLVRRSLEGRLAKVGIDQQHALFTPREILGQRESGRRFAFTRLSARHQKDLWNAAVRAE